MNARKKAQQWRLSEKAAVDLYEIGNYTETTWGLAQRNRYLDLIEECFNTLAATPDSGLDYSHIKDRYRRKTIGEHYVFYRLTENGIDIMRVLHQKRDIVRHLDEDEINDA